MVKKFVCVFVFLIFTVQTCFGADLSSIGLGDTVYNKPQIVQYFYADSIDGVSAEGFLDEEVLSVEGICPQQDTGLTTNYFFLADESTSISYAEMEGIKEGLRTAVNSLTSGETMSVVAFGTEINTKADHSTDKSELLNAVDSLDNDKEGTVFFDAVKRAGEMSNASPGDRNLVYIISDGIDFNTGGYTFDEVNLYAQNSGLTIFAIAIGDKDDEYIDKFGELARNSGGFIGVCDASKINSTVSELLTKARSAYSVMLRSTNNTVSTTNELLLLNFSENGQKVSLEKTMYSRSWVKDGEAPEVVSVEKSSDTSLSVVFSEDVLGAENVENYNVVLNGKHELKVDFANYDAQTHTVNLVFEKGVFTGEYTVNFLNITDNSMEANPLSYEYKGSFKGYNYQTVMFKEKAADYWFLLLFIFIVILAAAGGIAYSVINKRKGLIVHDKKLMFQDNMVEKERIITPQTTNICLVVTNSSGLNRKIEMNMYKSLIVGRSEMCDLSFDDALMSRQHFAIEENDGIYTIMNLSSTNGTTVNGVYVEGKRKLEFGDVILAGNEKFIFSSN